MPLTLPPLNSLRAFEAAARTGSFVAAAEELGVSAAAISQHIRKLEDYLGKDMFMRKNNRVILTDAGQAILSGIAEALHQISETTLDMTSDRPRSRLVISSIESVAEKWLLPRLVEYARAQPDFRFDLAVEPDPIDFARDNGRCCTTLAMEDSQRESIWLDGVHEQTITRPLPHYELAHLHGGAPQARVAADLAGQGDGLACAA